MKNLKSSLGEVVLEVPEDCIEEVIVSSSKKQCSPAKKWCFTLNNYTEDEISSIVPIFNEKCKIAFFSKEIGEGGTPHLQGFALFKVKIRPSSLLKKAHWTISRGSILENLIYCRKEGDLFYSKGVECFDPVKLINPVYEWEKIVLDEITKEPDDRTINWIWSEFGGIGKTSFCKYLVVKHDAIIFGGKACDIRNGVRVYYENNKHTPQLIIVNIPRSFDPMYISYEGFENIKDMLFYSGKFEGGMICGNCPHLYVFANHQPDISKMSEDRWKIRRIGGLNCFSNLEEWN